MQQNTKSTRLHALDGLRGLAILMVFLSHINATFITRSGILNGSLFNSGIIGVSFLFILSGFLMAYLYPQPHSALAFLQKRYTRIFPLFLTLCTALAVLSWIPVKQWYITIIILFVFACFSHLIWVYIVKKYLHAKYKKIIFFSFLIF